MTWEEFSTVVKDFLSVHKRRHGVQALIDRWIVAGVVDIQRFVEYFQAGNVNHYLPGDLTTNGYVQKGDMPDGVVTGFRIIKVDEAGMPLACNGGPLRQLSWSAVQAGACGLLDSETLGVAVGPRAREFYIIPKLDTGEALQVHWRGVKRAYAPTDTVDFTETVAQAVGEYVLARVSRLVDKDLPLAQSFEASYKSLRRALYADYSHRRHVGVLGSVSEVTESLIVGSPITTEGGSVITTEDGSVIVIG